MGQIGGTWSTVRATIVVAAAGALSAH